MTTIQELQNLANNTYTPYSQIAPEDELIHSLYISGQRRTNHVNIVEKPGHLQIRGVKYNLDEVNMIILMYKDVLVRNETIANQKEKTTCFSYKDARPWMGTIGKKCPKNSSERSCDEWCKTCKTHLIVCGVYTDEDGNPIKNEKGDLIYVFIRARGVKFTPVNNFLAECREMQFPDRVLGESTLEKNIEPIIVNNKRFVTKVTIGNQSTAFGDKDIFILSRGKDIPIELTKKFLSASAKILPEFTKKFDWTQNLMAGNTNMSPSNEEFDGNNITTDMINAATKSDSLQPSISYDDIPF